MMPFDDIKEFLCNNNLFRIVWTSKNGFAIAPIKRIVLGRCYSNKISDIIPVTNFKIGAPVKYIELTSYKGVFTIVVRIGESMSYQDIRNEYRINEFQRLYVKEVSHDG